MRISSARLTKQTRVRHARPSRSDLWPVFGPVYPSELALLWPSRLTQSGVRKSAAGPNPTWNYAGDMWAWLVNVGVNPPLHGTKGVYCGPAATSAQLPSDVPDGVTMPSAAGTSGGNGLAWKLDTKMLAALSGNCTVAALCTVGFSLASIYTETIDVLSTRDLVGDSPLKMYAYTGIGRIVAGNDGAQLSLLTGTWSANETHLKIFQVNSAGTQFRVGNKRLGINSNVQWGNLVAFDGSLNPLTHLRAAFGITRLLWLKGVQIWNKPEVSEADIEKQFKAVGVM